jgi:hypothetical protein
VPLCIPVPPFLPPWLWENHQAEGLLHVDAVVSQNSLCPLELAQSTRQAPLFWQDWPEGQSIRQTFVLLQDCPEGQLTWQVLVPLLPRQD